MSTDPRIEATAVILKSYLHGRIGIRDFLAAADAVDPLRAALRDPSDELIEQLLDLYHQATFEAPTGPYAATEYAGMRAVLAALARESFAQPIDTNTGVTR